MLKYVWKYIEYYVNGVLIDKDHIPAIIPEKDFGNKRKDFLGWNSIEEINEQHSQGAPYLMTTNRKGWHRFKFEIGLEWGTLKEEKHNLLVVKEVYYTEPKIAPSIKDVLSYPDVRLAIQYLKEQGLEIKMN